MYIIDNSPVNVGHKHIYIFFYYYSKAPFALLAANNIHEKQCSLENQEQKQQEGPKGMGRSPEEKVKGHSGAIYRGPLMLSTKY